MVVKQLIMRSGKSSTVLTTIAMHETQIQDNLAIIIKQFFKIFR